MPKYGEKFISSTKLFLMGNPYTVILSLINKIVGIPHFFTIFTVDILQKTQNAINGNTGT